MFYLKFFLRLIKHFFILTLISIPLQLIGIVVLAVYLPYHRHQAQKGGSIKLPYLLKWFDNADIYIGRNTSVYLSIFGSTTWNLYCWLAFRNPCNYFGYKVLGIQAYCIPKTLSTNYRYYVGDTNSKTPGFFYQEVEIRGKTYYEYYYIKKWTKDKCLRFRLGYKIGQPVFQTEIEQVLVLQPFKAYSGT